MADAAVSIAVETLGNLLIDKAVFLKGVKEEVEWVRDELKRMQCFLTDAARKQSDSHGIRNWISDIRKVAHDAEDAIEMFVRNVESRGILKRCACFFIHMYHLNKVGKEIQSIRKRLIDIEDSRRRYGIDKEESSAMTRSELEVETRRRLAYWQSDKDVVGMEKDVEILLGKAIFGKSEGLAVAAVVGMGGIGKSTLARKIYNHPEVARGFEFRAWVVVSSEFTSEDIMKQILQRLGVSFDDLKLLESIGDKLRRQEDLKKELHQRLAGKRYFIVLDDVWEAGHWESLSTAFPDGDEGGRLLLTSRNQVITTHDGYVHNMKPLGETESWDLFMRKAFDGNPSIDGCPEELRKVGGEILKKCGGLPLAISVVGGLLAKKTTSKSEWEKVYKEMNSHLDRSSGDLSTITAILELSYQNLSPELKACFLCLGFFKEDAIVKVKMLVHIWVAYGLVAQEIEGEEVRMEDVARDYLNELISRNMVQVKEMKYEKAKVCQMHDLLRDLSIRKAKEEIDFEEVREGTNSNQFLQKPRHRAIYCETLGFIYHINRNKYLRSLFIHVDYPYSTGKSSYWKSFELLKVLNLGTAGFHILSEEIGELTGLRYLKLSCSSRGEVRLPRSWAKLKNLEVLDMRGGFAWGIIIDKVILKMASLRHLYADVISCEVGLGNMKNLQTLLMFWLKSSSDLSKIEGMRGVSKLGIRLSYGIQETSCSLLACLSSLNNLHHLTISLSSDHQQLEWLTSLHRVTRLKLEYDGCFTPVYFPPNLSHLTLRNMILDKDPMPVLEKLPSLIHLKMDGARTNNYCKRVDSHSNYPTMVIRSGGFPRLKVFCIQNIEVLYADEYQRLKIEESAMPELNHFIVRRCSGLLDLMILPQRIKSTIVMAD